jgi:hypothetical protein
MPNIRPANGDISLDTIRQSPGSLYFLDELAKARIFKSYDAAYGAERTGRIKLIRVGRRLAAEGRDVLRMLGVSPAIPVDEPEAA